MKVALVTTSPSVRSGIGDYTRHLLPYLRELCDVELFVEPGGGTGETEGVRYAPVSELDPTACDRLLFQLGNETGHAFMPRIVRALGGTIMLHDWVLFDMACAAFPALTRGGLKGHALALREGGPAQAAVYARNWLERKRQRESPAHAPECATLPGAILAGWHEPEDAGRWTGDVAVLRLPATGVRDVDVALHLDAPRTARLVAGGRTVAESRNGALTAPVPDPERPLVEIHTSGIEVTESQRSHGDSRRLGAFVMSVRWRDATGWHELDLGEPAAVPIRPVTLSRDRFELSLNRSVVRHADSFVVHSRYVAERILADRNARTAIGMVHHGAERRWNDGDRRDERRRLGLPPHWIDGFIVVSFGGVQPHKRIDRLLAAIAAARRERPDVHVVLAGAAHACEFDAQARARQLGLGDAARFTGFVSEEDAWGWMRAGDVCVNLRGPTSGGTSGGIFQAFSNGRTVIASDAAEQRELPDCVLRVPLGEEEVDAIARTIVALRDDPARRDALEAGVRRFVEEECHWSVVARRYHEHLEGFSRPRVTRKARVAFGAWKAMLGPSGPGG
jgi:glycosyltransferase involved in cell wall biosynthesis